jgi:hypothetical protein
VVSTQSTTRYCTQVFFFFFFFYTSNFFSYNINAFNNLIFRSSIKSVDDRVALIIIWGDIKVKNVPFIRLGWNILDIDSFN